MKKNNILLIMTDQLRYDSLGCSGHPLVKTPNIDKLAERGLRFEKTFTTTPLCMPARISLATGLYPHNTNIWQNDDVKITNVQDTYIKKLQNDGYRTCQIGKSHLKYHENTDLKADEPYMHSLGFEDLFETQGTWSSVNSNSVFYDYLKEKGLNKEFDDYYLKLDQMSDQARRFITEPGPLAVEDTLDNFIGRTAVEYIMDYDDKRPSFLFVGFAGPHEPWDAPEKFSNMYKPEECPENIKQEEKKGEWLSEESIQYMKWAQYFQPKDPMGYKRIAANYFGKVSLIDEWVGKILKAYELRGWLDNTFIIFTSDHGEALGDHNRVSKSMFYESMVRIPLIISGSGVIRGTTEALTELIDIHPTILDLAGCQITTNINGKSLTPILFGQTDIFRKNILSQAHSHTMLRNNEWKIVLNEKGTVLQLFHILEDPMERLNLAGHNDYKQVEITMKLELLEKIISSQVRYGKLDSNYSAHESGLLTKGNSIFN